MLEYLAIRIRRTGRYFHWRKGGGNIERVRDMFWNLISFACLLSFHLVWRSGSGEYTEVGLDDFHVIRCIGLGGFSRVYLV